MSRKNIPCFSLNKNLNFLKKVEKSKSIILLMTTWNNKNNGLQFETENQDTFFKSLHPGVMQVIQEE